MFVLPFERYPNNNTLKEEQPQCPLSASIAPSVSAMQHT